MNILRVGSVLALLTVLLSIGGCFSYSSYQSPHLVEPGRSTITTSLSRNDYVETDGEIAGFTDLDIQMRFGADRRHDVGCKFSLLKSDDGWSGLVMGADIKGAIWKDHLAFDLPVSLLIGDFTFSSLQFYPGLIAGQRITRNLEVNGAAKTYVLFWGQDSPIYAFNLGLGWTPTQSAWTVRPELAWLWMTGSRKTYRQFGVGVEYALPAASSIPRRPSGHDLP